jgi:acetyl-CoA/propionyl-CoA carboxylase biotin carboxyl carrier protein
MSTPTKHKLLVANRSEIACRVFQGAFEMGISTVAIYAPGDEGARHVTMADEIAEVPSYLDVESIIAVSKKLGVTLIHPGYGFLSERPHFAKAVEEAGIHFLGPLAITMEAMGGKIAAKEIAEKIGVPTVPWAKLDLAKSSDAELKSAAEKVGFPILFKGMRRVDRFEDLKEQAESAYREAASSFGDGTLFFERYVQSPRHIEVQVFGDGKGSGIHLFERECSLQRRHQKVWEEAPAPHLNEKIRQGLYESAMKLVEYTKYRSAGTIEYLVEMGSDGEAKEFFFIEMNTRLQVEHPVTESITGLDLVHEQIKLAIAPNEYVLPVLTKPDGHSLEVRVYAEDPSQGFIPCTGTVNHLIWPSGPGIRLDRGVEVGQEMGTNFDSMCAKIIVKAPNRETALKRMQFALRETVISGIGTNLEYLNQIAHHPKVIEGRVTTHLLDKDFADFTPNPKEFDFQMLDAFEHSKAFHGSGVGTDRRQSDKTSTFDSASLWSGAVL